MSDIDPEETNLRLVDPKGVCSYCNKYFGKDNVKACSQCRLVRYCSKTCQVGAWKTHKPRCSQAAILRENLANDPEASALHNVLSKWINIWRATLQSWALFALDLANHPEEDRLATHSMVIQISRRPNPPNHAVYFEMHGGELMTRASFLARMCVARAGDISDEMVETMNERRTNDTAQIIVLCESDLVRVLWFSLRDGGAKLRQNDPGISQALAEDWEEGLIEAINTGTPATAEKDYRSKVLEKIILSLN